MLDNGHLESLMEALENHNDEQLAIELLKELNDATKELGALILNQDPNLEHSTWKNKCDEAKKRVDDIVQKIESLS